MQYIQQQKGQLSPCGSVDKWTVFAANATEGQMS